MAVFVWSEVGKVSIHQVSDKIRHIMYYRIVNVIYHILEERVGPKVPVQINGFPVLKLESDCFSLT